MSEKQRRIRNTVLAAIAVAYLVTLPTLATLLEYAWHQPDLAHALWLSFIVCAFLVRPA